MRISPTLSFYIGRTFLFWLTTVIAAFAAVVFLFDTLELMRRAQTRPEATFGLVLQMAACKLPHMLEMLLPFTMLFGAMLAFWRLTRSHELVVARAAGISVWQFLMPVALIAVALGVFKVTAYGPLASLAQERYERLDARYLQAGGNAFAMTGSGFWLRDAENGNQMIVHGEKVASGEHRLSDVTVFQFRQQDHFVRRLDAASASLGADHWDLQDVWVSGPNERPTRQAELTLPTTLTWKKIEESFASPETMSVWRLPSFIRALERAGFPAVRHRLHLYAEFATPLLLAGMVLIAATFSLRPSRRGGTAYLVAGGISTGFVFYVLSDIVYALGLSSRVPVELAAWAPAVVCLMLGVAALMHLEDG